MRDTWRVTGQRSLCLVLAALAALARCAVASVEGELGFEGLGQSVAAPAPADHALPVLRIGGPLQLSGPLAGYGVRALKAFEIWARWANSRTSSTPLNFRVELNFQDDASNVTAAAAIANQVASDASVQVLVAPYGSEASKAVVKAVAGRKPVLVWGGSSDEIFKQGFPHVFGTLTPSSRYMTAGLQMLYDAGANTLLLVHNSKAFSTSVCNDARTFALSIGYELLGQLQVADDGSDVKERLQSSGVGKVDVLVGCGHLADMQALVSALGESSVNPTAVLATQVGTAAFLSSLPETTTDGGQSPGCGLLMPTQWAKGGEGQDPLVGWSPETYSTEFQFFAGMSPTYLDASAAASAVALANAVVKAGGVSDIGAISREMSALDLESFFGKIRFSESGALHSDGKPMYTTQNQWSGGVAVVGPSYAKQTLLAYPEVCTDRRKAPEVEVLEEDVDSFTVVLVCVSSALAVLACMALGIMCLRVLSLHKELSELKGHGITIRRLTTRDMSDVAVGRIESQEAALDLAEDALGMRRGTHAAVHSLDAAFPEEEVAAHATSIVPVDSLASDVGGDQRRRSQTSDSRASWSDQEVVDLTAFQEPLARVSGRSGSSVAPITTGVSSSAGSKGSTRSPWWLGGEFVPAESADDTWKEPAADHEWQTELDVRMKLAALERRNSELEAMLAKLVPALETPKPGAKGARTRARTASGGTSAVQSEQVAKPATLRKTTR